jgi:hypothetical protein
MQTATHTEPRGRAARFAAWDAALRRAIAANLTALALPDGGYAISSSTDEDRGYIVDRHGSCQCKAAQHGNPYCQHAALAAALAGLIPWPVYAAVEDAAPAVEVAAVEVLTIAAAPCRNCRGRGWVWGDDYRAAAVECRCYVCNGNGHQPAA